MPLWRLIYIYIYILYAIIGVQHDSLTDVHTSFFFLVGAPKYWGCINDFWSNLISGNFFGSESWLYFTLRYRLTYEGGGRGGGSWRIDMAPWSWCFFFFSCFFRGFGRPLLPHGNRVGRWGACGWDQSSCWASGGSCGRLILLLHLVGGSRVPNGIASGWDQDAAGIRMERPTGPLHLYKFS